MKTILRFTIIDGKGSYCDLTKTYDGFLPFQKDSIIATGLWMVRVKFVHFKVPENALYVDLETEKEKPEKLSDSATLLIKAYGWIQV